MIDIKGKPLCSFQEYIFPFPYRRMKVMLCIDDHAAAFLSEFIQDVHDLDRW